MPSIEVGASTPSRIYVGNTRINRVYLGQQIVWPAFDTPAGPRGCWVPVFQASSPIVQIPAAHPETCRDDLNMVGDRTSVQASLDEGHDDYYGFDGVTDLDFQGYGIVSEPPAVDYPGGIVGLTTLRAGKTGVGNSITDLTVRFRRDNVTNGIVQQLTDDFYENGYLGIFLTAGSSARLFVVKASLGTRSSGTTLSFTQAQLNQNRAELFVEEDSGFYPTESGTDEGDPADTVPYITSDRLLAGGVYRSIGFFESLDAMRDLRYVENYVIGSTTPYPAIYYGRQWTTYGLGETMRALVARTSGTSVLGSSDRLYVSTSTSLLSTVALGSLDIDSSISVGDIWYRSSDRRLRVTRSSGSAGALSTYANGTGDGGGAHKSLYVACRGDMVELNFNFSLGFTGSDLPDYTNIPEATATASYIQWTLRDNAAGNAMHDHFMDFLRGDGYQMIFVIADPGTVQAVG